jgi:hypothetical protein
MPPPSFKLSDPTQPKGPQTAELPAWLENQISEANSTNTQGVLGNVDTLLLKADPEEQDNGYSNPYYVAPYDQPGMYGQYPVGIGTAKNGSNFWEVKGKRGLFVFRVGEDV